MKVTRIYPQGYCNGVNNALKIVNNTLNDPKVLKPIYLLGHVIHNKIVMKQIEDRGVIILENKLKSRLELLDEITYGTVIFSAHGVADSVYEKAKEKHLNIIDATCKKVLQVHDIIKNKILSGFTVIYIGTKNHPECEGVLGLDESIIFINDISDIEKLNINNNKIFSTNQTTLSIYDVKEIFEKLKSKYPFVEIDDKICDATTIRQKVLAEQKGYDLCIIVGDYSSSNTKKLAYVSENISFTKTILIESLKDLNIDLLKSVNNVSVSSGASTPKEITNEVIEFLKNFN